MRDLLLFVGREPLIRDRFIERRLDYRVHFLLVDRRARCLRKTEVPHDGGKSLFVLVGEHAILECCSQCASIQLAKQIQLDLRGLLFVQAEDVAQTRQLRLVFGGKVKIPRVVVDGGLVERR